MRLPIVASLICFVLLLCVSGNSLLAADDAPPGQPGDAPARKVQSSDKAVVRDVVYGLEEEEGRLYLTSRPLDGADRELKREEVKFAVPKEGQIVAVVLSKMGERHLAAVVKIRRGDEYDFHCLTFIAGTGEGVRNKYNLCHEKFFKTRDELRILALAGNGHTVFVALGDMDVDDDAALITNGVIYFTSCPWPPMGVVAPFTAKSKGIAN